MRWWRHRKLVKKRPYSWYLEEALKKRVVMVSGHYDPLHDAHLAYIKQAVKQGNWLICVVTSDKQLMMKKNHVNIPEKGRRQIVDLVLTGLGIPHIVVVNEWDTETTLVAEAIRFWKPDVFFRGNDKSIESMPMEERKACEELGVLVLHANLPFQRHGSEMVL